jgi:hypothetical protein
MLVQMNRRDTTTGPDRNVAGHDLPLNPPHTRSMAPTVAVLGQLGRVAGLDRHLPSGWTLRPARDLDDVDAGDLVLFTRATAIEVRTARAVLPARARIIALVDEQAPAETVAAVLTAGADVCVRGGHLAILAGHLVACRRRQLAARWNDLQDAAGHMRSY